IAGTPFGGLGAPNMEQIAAMGIQGPNMNPQVGPSSDGLCLALSADFLKLMQSMDPKLNPLAAGLNLSPGLKTDASSKEIEEAMKRVREAQSLISAAIEPGSKSPRRSRSRSHRRSYSKSRRRSKSPRRRRSHSRDRSRRSRSRWLSAANLSAFSEAKTLTGLCCSAQGPEEGGEVEKKVKDASEELQQHQEVSERHRHKKEKKKDKEREKDRDREKREDRDRSRDEKERSSAKKNKDKERDRERDAGARARALSTMRERERERERERDGDPSKPARQVTRDYDEEEQGYDSEKEGGEEEDERKSNSDSASSPKGQEQEERPESQVPKKSKLNGDDHHQEDMEMSD
ncbi:unnamed protein product, partial [Tetraodon nigroviridis]